MKIKKMKVSELIPNDANPRRSLTPNDREFHQLKSSIREFGYIEPIVVNEKTKKIISGHQRLAVMKYDNMTEVECVLVDLPEEKEKAAIVALNKISGQWDMKKLSQVLSDIIKIDIDVDAIGFDTAELERIGINLQETIGETEGQVEVVLDEMYNEDNMYVPFNNSTKTRDGNIPYIPQFDDAEVTEDEIKKARQTHSNLAQIATPNYKDSNKKSALLYIKTDLGKQKGLCKSCIAYQGIRDNGKIRWKMVCSLLP